ncbi:IS6 family transposase, partial [Streptomyces sp. NPDC127118]|uniref:IS6 family transposase n=1 Tax=Streptomyces sp. NPDC127118 TaxID=3345369 RepID=UPI003633C0CD
MWLYIRFPLSYREVEELMLQRGVIVSHETVRRWCLKFGQAYAAGRRRRQPRPGDKWHLDEVFIKINGVQKYLWRAVDQDGNVLDILVQNRRDKAAARRFFRRLMKKTRAVPRVIVTDKLRSYGAAHREIMLAGRAPRLTDAEPVRVSSDVGVRYSSQGRALGPAFPQYREGASHTIDRPVARMVRQVSDNEAECIRIHQAKGNPL